MNSLERKEQHPVLNWQLEQIAEIDLLPSIFQRELRKDILDRVVQWQLAKRRSGNHKTKGISEISGTTRKPYRQKGTGNARHGSRRSPQFVGGATIFGPVVRSHAYSLNKKIRTLGLCVALSLKQREGKLIILDNAIGSSDSTKTKYYYDFFGKLGAKSALLVSPDHEYHNISKGVANLLKYNALHERGLNVYDILRHDHLIISKQSLEYIEGRLQ
jgi:large subunit ribosomal protein L4